MSAFAHEGAERATHEAAVTQRIAEIEQALAKVGQPITPADLAHQRLVRLADGLKALGDSLYATNTGQLFDVLVASGAKARTIVLDTSALDYAERVVEGVTFRGSRWRKATEAELAAQVRP